MGEYASQERVLGNSRLTTRESYCKIVIGRFSSSFCVADSSPVAGLESVVVGHEYH